MARSFGLVDYKVKEAEYFLNLMIDGSDEIYFTGIQFCASAFAAATRSITFAMQASLKNVPRFDSWYSERQKEMRSNPLAKFFHDFRTVTQHIGESVVNAGSHIDGKTLYFFKPCSDLPSVPELDVVSACRMHFCFVLDIVYLCYIDMGIYIDGQQYFTAQHFQNTGKTIEDAEEELGFPRGWTDIGGPNSEPYRWEALRREADGCGIQEQFEFWLGKTVPTPELMPPYSASP